MVGRGGLRSGLIPDGRISIADADWHVCEFRSIWTLASACIGYSQIICAFLNAIIGSCLGYMLFVLAYFGDLIWRTLYVSHEIIVRSKNARNTQRVLHKTQIESGNMDFKARRILEFINSSVFLRGAVACEMGSTVAFTAPFNLIICNTLVCNKWFARIKSSIFTGFQKE